MLPILFENSVYSIQPSLLTIYECYCVLSSAVVRTWALEDKRRNWRSSSSAWNPRSRFARQILYPEIKWQFSRLLILGSGFTVILLFVVREMVFSASTPIEVAIYCAHNKTFWLALGCIKSCQASFSGHRRHVCSTSWPFHCFWRIISVLAWR